MSLSGDSNKDAGSRKCWPVTAVFLMIGSALSFSLMGAAVKGSTLGMPFVVSLFFRSFPPILPLGAYLLIRNGTLRSVEQKRLFQRSALGFMAMVMFFYAIEKLPLSTAVILNQSSPVFTVIFSALLLKERNVGRVFPLVILAFVGVAVLIGPDVSSVGIEVSIGLASAVLAALAYVTVKQLSENVSAPVIVFYFAVWGGAFSILIIGVMLLTGWGGLDPGAVVKSLSSFRALAVLLSIAFFGVTGQLLMTSSYARAKASQVSPFGFFNPLFAYVIGLTVFDETLALHRIAGGLLVVAGSSLIPFVASRSADCRKNAG